MEGDPMSGGFFLDASHWLTRPVAVLVGILLITMPYYTRVRVHMRMSDEAFANVRRASLWAQTLGIGVLVLLGGAFLAVLLDLIMFYGDEPQLLALAVVLSVFEFHLLARWLQSIALGSRWRRLRRGQQWRPAPVTQYILAYPAVFTQGATQPRPPQAAVQHRGLNPGLDPLTPVAPGTTPASFQQVLDAVHRQVAEANERASALEEELSETRRHVSRLEHDLIERRAEIVLLEAAQTRFEDDMEQQSARSDGKSLSMQDSVVAGDAFVGSTVIDRQIVNDPEAIARAVLDAYRSGRGEA